MATTRKATPTSAKATSSPAGKTPPRKNETPALAQPDRQPGDDLEQEDYAQFDG
jgi:hypothetical protein